MLAPELRMPDVQALCVVLADKIRPHINTATALIGIQSGGLWAAQRLHSLLGIKPPLGEMNVSFYRDDYHSRGLATGRKPSAIPFEVAGAHIILIDDVLYTGRTVRAAMNELFDYGRPARVDLAVLVDRGGRELPIAPTWYGQSLILPAGKTLDLQRDEQGVLHFQLAGR